MKAIDKNKYSDTPVCPHCGGDAFLSTWEDLTPNDKEFKNKKTLNVCANKECGQESINFKGKQYAVK